MDRQLVKSGVIEDDVGVTVPLEKRIQRMLILLTEALPTGVTYLVIEDPQMFGTAVSTAAVHNNSLKKLIMIVGALVWYGYLMKAAVKLIPVGRWKGQLPKHITKQDMEKKYQRPLNGGHANDEADAVGIGDWFIVRVLTSNT